MFYFNNSIVLSNIALKILKTKIRYKNDVNRDQNHLKFDAFSYNLANFIDNKFIEYF